MKGKGFTLVEMVIAVAVAAIAGTLLIQLLIQSNGLFYQQTAKVNQGLKLNDTTLQIEADVKSAAAIAASYLSFTTSSSTLVLKIPSLDASGNVIDQNYDFLVIYKDSTNPKILRRRIFPSAPPSLRGSLNQVLLTNLSDITFLYYDKNGAIVSPTAAAKINFTLNASTPIGLNNQQASASGEVSLRND